MYDTSTLYNTLIAGEHWFETKVDIAGNTCTRAELMEVSADYRMFAESQPAVGGCLAGELYVKLLNPAFTIPRMALVEPYVRVTNRGYDEEPDLTTNTSEWVPQGKFWIDTRETTKNDDNLPILTLHCYDAMLKAETDYPGTTHSWPYSDWNTVKEISYFMGLSQTPTGGGGVDSRTQTLMNKGYSIGLPVGYTMREVLSQIAAMYAGNFVMTYDGKLLLVAINGIPAETNYLIDNIGEPITFGGDRILV